MENEDTVLLCPNCNSHRVTLSHEQMFMANTGEHYCHSVKIQDSDAKSRCLACGWAGTRIDLQEEKKGG